ncbi:MAG TPA: SRPBCC family protein [Anaerolineales bacterium]|nr:SRPBCC family protein [Anaerolineales bacterium]HRF48103.1 SRPBCC family protein [Anaerolineales bacterium]
MGKSYYSTVFDAPAANVWAAARDFNGLATWFAAAVVSSEIEDGKTGESVSSVRNFLFGETRIREQLVALSDVDCSYTYRFCDPAPFPVQNYLATLRVTPITDGDRAFVEWWTTFDCKAKELEHWTGFFASEVFKPALESLRVYIKG